MELTIFEKKDLTLEEESFVNLHNRIVQSGTYASMYIYDMCKLLKEMHDQKKYQHAGFDNFEEYTETVLNIKKRQAYNYISIASNLSEDFVHSSAQNFGIKKLSLLASLGEEKAVELVKNNDVNEMTVNDLNKKIRELNQELIEKDNRYKQLELDFESLNNKPNEVKEVIKEVKVEDTSKIDSLQKKINSLEKKNEKLQKEVESIKNDTISIKYEDAIKKNEELTSKCEELEKKNLLNSNEDFTKFRVMFNLLKNSMDDLKFFINNLSDLEFQNKCITAFNKLLEVSKYE